MSNMSSPRKLETCAQHTLSATDDKKEERAKRLHRAQWLRAAILGANDGLLSNTSLMLGVGAAIEDQWSMILSGLAGALAGAFSMAVGEFVSVSTQRDIEIAAIEKCSSKVKLCDTDGVVDNDIKLETDPNQTIVGAKLPEPELMSSVSCSETNDSLAPPGIKSTAVEQDWTPVSSPARSPIMKVVISDAKKCNAKETNELDEETEALPNPYRAAFTSAGAFLCGSIVPLVAAVAVANNLGRIIAIVVVTSIALALFGGIGAHLGGLPLRVSAARVLAGGWISMVITYGLLKPLETDDHKGGHDTDD
ncbi:hypothetical protein LguiB_018882 [Lonicera macranthoides]